MSRLYKLIITITFLFLLPLPARAQVMPGGQPTPGAPGPDAKKDGVAEQAPKKLGILPTTPVLPPPREERKELRVFSLDGYFRLRGDWKKKHDLGFRDDATVGGAPFTNPLGCRLDTTSCERSITTTNMRLRLEPIIHIDERSAVFMQVDVLDNLVLGSTPAGYALDGSTPRPSYAPTNALENNQQPPRDGLNNFGDSIAVKRAWAEIDAPFGLLKFGRMPWHWGMGMVANSGAADPLHGTYNLNGNFGDNVDRVMFSAGIPGTDIQAAIATDWSLTAPSSAQSGAQGLSRRQSWDLDDTDDLSQWVFTLSRIDTPEVNKDRIADGEAVFNYGAFVAYRTQDWDQLGSTLGNEPPEDMLIRRDLTAYVPDIWLHFAKGKLDLELEAVAVFGSMQAPDLGAINEVKIRQLGAVGRLGYKLMDDDLNLSYEMGYASGDQWDNTPAGATHVDNMHPGIGPGDNTMAAFLFDFEYQVDLILFRELLGTVTNATYAKPSFTYDLTKRIALSGAGILSFANKPVATPGNSSLYGLELDASLGYSNKGFFAGLYYGVLFPFGALDHPDDLSGQGGPGFGFGTNVGDADTAQTIQTRLVLQF
jgi:uncharacterized protein (TIGR04551 family)